MSDTKTARSAPHANQLDVPDGVTFDPKAAEVLRAWVAGGGLTVALSPLAFERIGVWGILLVDVARHVARAWEAEGKGTFSSNLEAINQMFKAEIKKPTDMGSTAKRQTN